MSSADKDFCCFCSKLCFRSDLILYATRRYAHPLCLLISESVETFLDALPVWKTRPFPAPDALKKAGVSSEKVEELIQRGKAGLTELKDRKK